MNNTNAKKVLVMQKKAIRTISNAKYNEHTAPLFLKHQILPYNLMQKQFILSLVLVLNNLFRKVTSCIDHKCVMYKNRLHNKKKLFR
jgi:hypothetical protein